MYTCIRMPNKTIYVKETDVPLLAQAQEQLGESVSSMFAEFLRERVSRLTPEENRIIELINQIEVAREAVKKDRDLPEFVECLYAEAQRYGAKALKNLRGGDVKKTKTFFWAANTYYEKAQRDARDAAELAAKIDGIVGRSR